MKANTSRPASKLFEIADFSTMWFMFRAYEQDMPWIKIGPDGRQSPRRRIPGKVFAGKITFIDPNFDEATRSTKVRVELPTTRSSTAAANSSTGSMPMAW